MGGEHYGYITGFLVFSLKKYNPLATEITILLDSWGSKCDNDFGSSFEESTKFLGRSSK